jgi:predicted PurR-regulated permease PerM
MLLFPLLRSEIDLLLLKLPDLMEAVRTKLFSAQEQMGQGSQWGAGSWKSVLSGHLQDAGSVANKLLPWLSGGGAALLGVLMNILLIPLAMFYLLRDWPALLDRIDRLIPRRWHAQTLAIIHEVDEILAQFMRGQITVMLLMSVFYSLGLWLVGVEFSLPIGIVSGLLVFIPYVGVIVGVGLATLVSFTQFGQWSAVFWVWFIFGIGQLLEGMVVTPKFVGERIGLHPLAVVFALLACGQLFGFFGVLLALPMAAIVLVGLRHFKVWYLTSDLYREPK